MVSLVAAIVETRRRMDRKTHDQNSKPYHKGRTGQGLKGSFKRSGTKLYVL